MRWSIRVQRIDNSGFYAIVKTIRVVEGEGLLEHDRAVARLMAEYGKDDHVRLVGPGRSFYKDTNLGVHYI